MTHLCCVTPGKFPSLSGPPPLTCLPHLGPVTVWGEEGSQRGRQPARWLVALPSCPPTPHPGLVLGGACPGLTATPTPPLSPQVFSIVVFGSIVNEGYLNSPSESEEFCIYNRNPNACGYGVTVGVLAFLTCLLYLALDVYFPQISSVKDRKKAVLSDISVSGEPHPSGYCACLPPPAAQSLQGALLTVILLSLTHTWEVAATLLPVFQMGKPSCRLLQRDRLGVTRLAAGSCRTRAGPETPRQPTAHGRVGTQCLEGVPLLSLASSGPPPWWSPVRTKLGDGQRPCTQ